jgi:hypothetical protein
LVASYASVARDASARKANVELPIRRRADVIVPLSDDTYICDSVQLSQTLVVDCLRHV